MGRSRRLLASFLGLTVAAALLFGVGATTGHASPTVRSQLVKASVDTAGADLPLESTQPAISGNGRHVAFVTASPIDAADTNEKDDVYVRDARAGTTTWVSRSAAGGPAIVSAASPAVSGDGRYVAFVGTVAATPDVFVVDRGAPVDGEFTSPPGAPEALGDGADLQPKSAVSSLTISADGLQLAFAVSSADNPGTVYVVDRDRNRNGQPGEADDLKTTVVPLPDGGDHSGAPRISADGLHVVFEVVDEDRSATLAYVYDRALSGALPLDEPGNTRVSLVTSPQYTQNDSEGVPHPDPYEETRIASPDISGDGSVVAYAFEYFTTTDSGLPPVSQIIVVTRGGDGTPSAARVASATGQDDLAEQAGDGPSHMARLSDDARYVAFVSEATNFVASPGTHARGCTPGSKALCNAYVTDLGAAGAPVGASFLHTGSTDPTPGSGATYEVAISATGRNVAMTTASANLVTDTDGNDDVLLLEWTPNLVAAPAPVLFPDTHVGSTTTVNVTIDTEDFGPWQLAGFTMGPGDSFGAAPASCAGATLHAGAGCAFAATFTPPSVGTHGSSVAVVTERSIPPTGDQLVVQLAGTSGVPAASGTVRRVSLGSAGLHQEGELKDRSAAPAISANGRYVAFETVVDLDPRDENGVADIYVRDRLRTTTAIVSLREDGTNPASAGTDVSSRRPTISGDGRFVAFQSRDEKVAEPTPIGASVPPNDGASDIYIVDRGAPDANGDFTAAPVTQLVSILDDGAAIARAAVDASISGDGRQVAFTVLAEPLVSIAAAASGSSSHVLVRDLDADRTRILGNSAEMNDLREPAMSADGDHVAFVAETLLADDGSTGVSAFVVHVYDRDVDGDGVREEDAGDVRYTIVTDSSLTPVTADDGRAHPLEGTSSAAPAIDGDGSTIAYQFAYHDDAIVSPLPFGTQQVIVVDRQPDSGGIAAAELVSRSGAGPIEATAGDGDSFAPDLSDDGRYVAFATGATNLHADNPDLTDGECTDLTDCDVLAVDRQAPGNGGAPQLVHPALPTGSHPDGTSYEPAVSGDGRFIAFTSDATNILLASDPADTNGASDVFVREWDPVVGPGGTMSFPDTVVGHSATPQSATVATTEFGPAPVLAVGVAGPAAGDFPIIAVSGCSPTLSSAPVSPVSPVPTHARIVLDAQCTVTVGFTPSAAGARSASLHVVVGSPFSHGPVRTAAVGLQGVGVVPTPQFTVSPTIVDFGEQPVGIRSPSRAVTVRNTGVVPFTVPPVALVGPHRNDYLVASSGCIGDIAPGAGCTVRVAFDPNATGRRNAALPIVVRPVLAPSPDQTITVRLTGVGVRRPVAIAVSIEPNPVDFGPQVVGAPSGPRAVTLTNVGSVAIAIDGPGLAGADPGDFVISSTTCPGAVLAPLASCTTNAAFLPTTLGLREAALAFVASAPGAVPLEADAALLGSAIPGDDGEDPFVPGPRASVAPATIDFGEHIVTVASEPRSVEVRNTGGQPLSVDRVELAGSHAGEFRVSSSTCEGREIAPGASCSLRLVFVPGAPGPRSANVDVTTTGGSAVVDLVGQGATPMLSVNPAVSIPSRAVEVRGENWAPNSVVTITMVQISDDTRLFPERTVARADADGRLAAWVLLFPRSTVGTRNVVATGSPPVLVARAPLLVVLPGINGPDFVIRG